MHIRHVSKPIANSSRCFPRNARPGIGILNPSQETLRRKGPVTACSKAAIVSYGDEAVSCGFDESLAVSVSNASIFSFDHLHPLSSSPGGVHIRAFYLVRLLWFHYRSSCHCLR